MYADGQHHGLSSVHVLAQDEIAPMTYLLTLEQTGRFEAGQTIRLALDPTMEPRIYSLCSGPGEAFQVLYNIKDGGLLTPQLAQLGPGDVLYSSAPYGSFVSDAGPAWWIATGTGIAPFRSMARAGLGREKRLLHGARRADLFFFREELENKLGSNYTPCCSRESTAIGFHGRVTACLASFASLPRDVSYYLCGSAIMVVEVRDLLISRGIPFTAIHSEIYF